MTKFSYTPEQWEQIYDYEDKHEATILFGFDTDHSELHIGKGYLEDPDYWKEEDRFWQRYGPASLSYL